MKQDLIKIGTGPGSRLLSLDLSRLVETRMSATASSGFGKSFLLRTVIEGAHRHTQVIILDTEGEFSTLRPTYDFIILGKDGDTGFHPYYGKAYALAFLESGKHVVIDLSELSIKEKQAFVRDFLQAMVDAPRNLWHDVLVVLDEAHEFAPEQGSAVSSEAVISMASKGRKRGFALLMATQRPSKLSKDASAECTNKLIGVQNLPIDRKRAGDELGFSTKEELLVLRDMVPGQFFACGPAFILGNGERLRGVEKVTINEPKTRPAKRGAARARVKPASDKLKKELEKLASLPKVTEQETRTQGQLQAEIEALRRQLAKKPAAAIQVAGPSAAQLKQAEAQAAAKLQTIGRTMGATMMNASKLMDQVLIQAKRAQLQLVGGHDLWAADFKARPELLRGMKVIPLDERSSPRDKRQVKTFHISPLLAESQGPAGGGAVKNSPCEKAIVSFLAIRPGEWFDNRRIAAMADYSAGSGSFRNALSSLNTAGIIERQAKQTRLKEGIGIAGLIDGRVHTLEAWIERMSPCEKAIVKTLRAQRVGLVMGKEYLASQTDNGKGEPYQSSSGSFRNALSRLSTMAIIIRSNGGFAIHPDAESFA